MKQILHTLLVFIVFMSYSGVTEAKSLTVVPPDSSSSLIDRAASSFLVDEGRKLYNTGKMRDALRKFREAYVRDKFNAQAAYWIGRSHYQMSNYGYALKYAKIAESLSEADDGEVFMLLGEAYHRQSLLDSARMNYDLAKIQLSSSKQRAFNVQQKIDEIAFAQSVDDQKQSFARHRLEQDISSGYDDYAAFLSHDGKELFFTSRRPDTKGGNINPDDQRYFEDVYLSRWDEEAGEWSEATNDVERLNSEGFDVVNHLSADGNTAYMTVNTEAADIRNKRKTNGSDICISERTKEDRWNTPKPITNSSINTTFFDGLPTLTEDGNTMYFMSDRDGQNSRSDIYVVYKQGNKWGEAQKLPMTVNTVGDETTPYITPDNRYLFFSSNGLKGMGGYDIYVTENLGDTWTEPKNLGPDFNTVNNDLYFKFFEKFNKVLLSTYRLKGNKASIDIFEMDVEGWEIP